MGKENLSVIYHVALHSGAQRIVWLEKYLACHVIREISEDDIKNESTIYSNLFANSCKSSVLNLYLSLIEDMRGTPVEQCSEMIEAFVFLQELLARALWKFQLTVDDKLERFARDFDRLDIKTEQLRLYEKCQAR